ERPATDAPAGAAGRLEHVAGGLRGGHIAIADDGNGVHGLDHGADAVEVDAPGKALGASATVHENGRDAGVLQDAREVGGGEILFVPAETHLGGYGNVHGLDHAAHERGGFAQFGHHGGTTADVDDLAHGAAHVDVDG